MLSAATVAADVVRTFAMRPCVTLGIAGGTGSGKTTLAKAVFNELGGSDNVVYISHDFYYKDISHKPMEERAATNFDHPDSLETKLLVQHLRQLKAGQAVPVPTYDFATHSRTPVTRLTHSKKIILVEGILLFADNALCNELDIKVYVDADNDTRVVRRIARDRIERGRDLESIMAQYQKTVKPMHAMFVEPSKQHANVIVNSETGHTLDIAVKMLSNHLRTEAGIESTPVISTKEILDNCNRTG